MLILETGEDILLDMAPVWDHTDHQTFQLSCGF